MYTCFHILLFDNFKYFHWYFRPTLHFYHVHSSYITSYSITLYVYC